MTVKNLGQGFLPQARQESLKIKINFLDVKVQHSHDDVSIFLNYFTNSYHNTHHSKLYLFYFSFK